MNQDGEASNGITRYVKITDSVICEIRITDIKDIITDYINGLEFVFDGIYRDSLMEVIQQKASILFSDTQLEFLDYCDVDILKDTADTAYYPFKNCIVSVDRNGIHTSNYNQLNGKLIWKDKIINSNYEENYDYKDFSFNRFVRKINDDKEERINYFSSCLGYILHGYKDELNPVCVILGEQVSDSQEGGGAGKGLITTAIAKIVNQVIIDGKDFKSEKTFSLQRVAIDTQLVVIQDTDERFNFESLFSKLTDGLTVEKKNKDEFFIPYCDSPKFMITTNYTIPNTSSAARRRQRLIEFNNFFNDAYTPFDYLGEYLFYGWNKDNWNKFYTIMFDFVAYYFQHGLLKMKESDSSTKKRISNNYTQEFYDFFKELSTDYQYQFDTAYHAFLSENGFNEKSYSNIRFSKGLDDGCQAFGYKRLKKKNESTKKALFILSTGAEIKESVCEEEETALPF